MPKKPEWTNRLKGYFERKTAGRVPSKASLARRRAVAERAEEKEIFGRRKLEYAPSKSLGEFKERFVRMLAFETGDEETLKKTNFAPSEVEKKLQILLQQVKTEKIIGLLKVAINGEVVVRGGIPEVEDYIARLLAKYKSYYPHAPEIKHHELPPELVKIIREFYSDKIAYVSQKGTVEYILVVGLHQLKVILAQELGRNLSIPVAVENHLKERNQTIIRIEFRGKKVEEEGDPPQKEIDLDFYYITGKYFVQVRG